MEVHPWNRFKLQRTTKVSNRSQSRLDIQPSWIPIQSRMVVQPPKRTTNYSIQQQTMGPRVPRFCPGNHPGTPRNQSSALQKWLLASECRWRDSTGKPGDDHQFASTPWKLSNLIIGMSKFTVLWNHPQTWVVQYVFISQLNMISHYPDSQICNHYKWYFFICPTWTYPKTS